MTPAEIAAEIRAEFPDPPGFPVRVGGRQIYVTGEAYEAMLADKVALQVAQQEAAAAQAAWQQMIDQFVNGMEELRQDRTVVRTAITNNTNLTQPQIKKGFDDVLTALIWLGERIGDGTIPTRRP